MRLNDLQRMLVQRALVSSDQLAEAIADSHPGRTWLEGLVANGWLDEVAVVAMVVARATIPACDLSALGTVSGGVLALVPPDVAIEHRVVPVSLDGDGDLVVAMIDPLDEAAVGEAQFFVGKTLLRTVAPVSAVAWALRAYYGWRGALSRPRAISDVAPLALAR
jgi:hypothetical protein